MQVDFASHWYRQSLSFVSLLLLPLAFLFGVLTSLRRALYRKGFLKTKRFSVPVIVVGNITVGGTGKTPFVIALVQFLQAHGYKPGIVSRGVGGKKHKKPYWVKENDPADRVGDEALLLSKLDCPLVLCVDRPKAVQALLQTTPCDVVISDDGLQHYRLGRDVEVIMVDGKRRFGNQQLLPAGPLREPLSRLKRTDFIVVNGGQIANELSMQLQPAELVSLANQQTKSLTDFANQSVHAVAGIGHPERFFDLLKQAGLHVIPHVFPDHYLYRNENLNFNDSLPIIMTEKDAVKCKDFNIARCWYLRVTVKIDSRVTTQLLEKLKCLRA